MFVLDSRALMTVSPDLQISFQMYANQMMPCRSHLRTMHESTTILLNRMDAKLQSRQPNQYRCTESANYMGLALRY